METTWRSGGGEQPNITRTACTTGVPLPGACAGALAAGTRWRCPPAGVLKRSSRVAVPRRAIDARSCTCTVIRVFSFFEYLTFSEILRLHIEYNRHTTQRTNKSQHGALRREGEFTPRSKRDAEVHARHEDSHRSDCAIVQRSGSRTGELACDRPPSRRPVSSGASTTQRPQSLRSRSATRSLKALHRRRCWCRHSRCRRCLSPQGLPGGAPSPKVARRAGRAYRKYSGVRRVTCGSPRLGAGSNCMKLYLRCSSTSRIAAWLPQR